MKRKKTIACGIVEGFFSDPLRPWSHRERLNTLEFLGAHAPAIDTYFYCPKQDPYVTASWDSLYPKSKVRELKSVISYCNSNKINFIYGLNPAIEPKHILSPKDRKLWLRLVERKLKQVMKLGCKRIALLFDDIPVAYDACDNSVRPEHSVEARLVELTNEVYRKFKRAVKEFWFCPPDYCITKATPLTVALKQLNPEIPLIWTGDEIFVKSISNSGIKRVKRLSGEHPVIWWHNYPVNDCEQNLGVFNLGGFYPPPQASRKELYGILVNPMRECFSNFPLYMSFSKYIKSPGRYSRQKAFGAALNELFGKAGPDLTFLITEFSSRNAVDKEPGFLLKKLARAKTEQALSKQLQRVKQALKTVRADRPKNIHARRFLQAISQVLTDADRFVKLAEKILSGQSISKSQFARDDWFPTNPTVARYLPEIGAIVRARLMAASRIQGKRAPSLEKEQALIKSFKRRYRGQEKLRIKTPDQKLYIRTVRDLLRKEQDQYLALLNSTKTKPLKKIQALALRQSLNRFTIEM